MRLWRCDLCGKELVGGEAPRYIDVEVIGETEMTFMTRIELCENCHKLEVRRMTARQQNDGEGAQK